MEKAIRKENDESRCVLPHFAQEIPDGFLQIQYGCPRNRRSQVVLGDKSRRQITPYGQVSRRASGSVPDVEKEKIFIDNVSNLLRLST